MTQKMTRAHYKILKYTVTKTHQKVLELSKIQERRCKTIPLDEVWTDSPQRLLPISTTLEGGMRKSSNTALLRAAHRAQVMAIHWSRSFAESHSNKYRAICMKSSPKTTDFCRQGQAKHQTSLGYRHPQGVWVTVSPTWWHTGQTFEETILRR